MFSPAAQLFAYSCLERPLYVKCRHWNQPICCIPTHFSKFRWGPQINRASGCKCKIILFTLFCSFWNFRHIRIILFHNRKLVLSLLPVLSIFCIIYQFYYASLLCFFVCFFFWNSQKKKSTVGYHLSILIQNNTSAIPFLKKQNHTEKKLNADLLRQRSTC